MTLEKLAPSVFAFPEVAAPGTAPSGHVYLYFKSDGLAYIKDDAGTETSLVGATITFDGIAPTTTKGDLIVHDGADNVRLAAGTNGYTLYSNSGATNGVEWKAPVVSNNKIYKFGSNQSTTNNSMVDVDATNAAITATLQGGKTLVTFSFFGVKGTAGSGFFRLTDGTNHSTEVEIAFSTSDRNLAVVQWVFDSAAGSTTYKLQYRSNDANAVFLVASTGLSMTVLEVHQ